MLRATEDDIARFLSYVEVLPSGCWFWTGARSRGRGNRKWYASFRLGRRTVRGHRFSCDVIAERPCPPDHDRDHTCSFSLCVSPEHLEIVPKTENQARRRTRRAADVSGAVYFLGGRSYNVVSGRLVPIREKREVTRKPSIKYTPVESSAEDAISYAYGTITDLRDEIAEVVSSMEGSPGLSATSRYSTLSETKDALDGPADDEKDWPDELSGVDIRCSYTENREKKLTRAGRRDNASGALDAAIGALRDWADEAETAAQELSAEAEGNEMTRIDAARTLADELETHRDAIDGCEFPGMRG